MPMSLGAHPLALQASALASTWRTRSAQGRTPILLRWGLILYACAGRRHLACLKELASVLKMSSSTARRLVYLVGCGSWLVLAKAAGSPSIDLPQHHTEKKNPSHRPRRPIREWSAPPAALLE